MAVARMRDRVPGHLRHRLRQSDQFVHRGSLSHGSVHVMTVGTYGDDCISQHTAVIYDRGGTSRIASLRTISEIQWARERSQMSQAKVILSERACAQQGDILDSLQPHRNELVIFRGNNRVWEGPVTQVTWKPHSVEILASDVMAYIHSTILSANYPGPDGGGHSRMTERVRYIMERELHEPYVVDTGTRIPGHMRPTPVFTMVPRWETFEPQVNVWRNAEIRFSDSLLTRSSTLAFEMSLGEHLHNLAQSGLDYTTVGRRLLVWDSAGPLGRTRVLTEADFYGDLTVIQSGKDHATIAHIAADRSELDPNLPTSQEGVGSAVGETSYYGPWTILHTLTSEEGSTQATPEALNSQAQRMLRGASPVPLVVTVPTGSSLKLSHDLKAGDLVPGTVLPVRAKINYKTVSQEQLLEKVVVTEDSDGETVQVTLSPHGEYREA